MPVAPAFLAPPSGRALARVVAALMRNWRHAALAGLRRGRVAVPPPTQEMADALLPIFARYYRDGAARSAASRPRRRKKTGGDPFGVFNPRILDAIRQAVFFFLGDFAQSTADMLREALAASLESGETAADLQRRLVPIFGTQRAFTVGQTESSRATHAGQVIAARESGEVRGMEWLVSADACDRCLALDGKESPLGEPFVVLPGGGPYAVVFHPPLHPHCFCSMTEVLR